MSTAHYLELLPIRANSLSNGTWVTIVLRGGRLSHASASTTDITLPQFYLPPGTQDGTLLSFQSSGHQLQNGARQDVHFLVNSSSFAQQSGNDIRFTVNLPRDARLWAAPRPLAIRSPSGNLLWLSIDASEGRAIFPGQGLGQNGGSYGRLDVRYIILTLYYFFIYLVRSSLQVALLPMNVMNSHFLATLTIIQHQNSVSVLDCGGTLLKGLNADHRCWTSPHPTASISRLSSSSVVLLLARCTGSVSRIAPFPGSVSLSLKCTSAQSPDRTRPSSTTSVSRAQTLRLVSRRYH